MKPLALLAVFVATFGVCPAQYIPPDLYDEDYNKAIGFWENKGKIVDSSGDSTDVMFYSEGAFRVLTCAIRRRFPS